MDTIFTIGERSMPGYAMAVRDARGAPRDEVMHRTRVTDPTGRSYKLVIVNISATGLMARCEGDAAAGDKLCVHLPIFGQKDVVVRWSLGGRIGCEFERAVPLDAYYGMLSVMTRHI